MRSPTPLFSDDQIEMISAGAIIISLIICGTYLLVNNIDFGVLLFIGAVLIIL